MNAAFYTFAPVAAFVLCPLLLAALLAMRGTR